MGLLNRAAESILRQLFPAVLIVGGCLLPAPVQADDYSPEVEQRIVAVEQGLIPAVRIRGKSSPVTIAERLKLDRVPGVSVAVINDHRIEWAKGYGQADEAAGTPVTAETLFQAASMSKPLTALAALKLVEQGRLDLNTDVNTYLKSWHLPENEFTRQHAVDLRGLLSHTAGLTVHGFPGYVVDAPLPTVPQILDGVKPANTAAVRVDKVPGHGFRYSGGGTTIVQQLLIDVTGQSFTDLMRDSVLAPLGMSTSTYEQPLPADRQSQAASGYETKGKAIPGAWHVYPEQGAAALWTTPSDMARYMIAVQQARRGENDKVLKKELLDVMLTPQGGGPAGLGPFLVERNGTWTFGHGGGNAGFRCNFVAFINRGQGAVVMTNSDDGSRAVNEITNSIAAVYDWPGYLPPERVAEQVDSEVLDRLVGEYALNVANVATIARRGERLFLKLPRQPEMELHPQTDKSFVTEEPEVTGRYVVDEQGRITRIEFQFGEREVSAKRVP